MNGYKQGSITEKLNKLKANPSQKPTGIIPPPPAPSIPPKKDQTKNNQNPNIPPPPAPSIPPEKDQTKNNQNPIIPSPPIEKKKEDSDTDANFLASLIGQGFAMMGAGIANRDPGQVGQQISQNRAQSEKFASEEEQRKLLNKERLDQIERAKRLLDPQSEESKQKRMTYGKALGLNIPESTTAADLENSDFLRSLMHDKDMQSKMALENQKLGMRGSGGSGTGAPKQGKSDKKTLEEYTEHVRSLASSSNVMDAVKNLNRTGIGSLLPDLRDKTKLNASSIDREAQSLIKALAGPGTLTDAERAAFRPMVTNSSMNSDLAAQNTRNTVIEGTNKAINKLRTDMNVGLISPNDYKSIINDYNEQITKPNLGINKVIDPNTGELVDRVKKQGTLNGKTVYFDQFGYRY